MYSKIQAKNVILSGVEKLYESEYKGSNYSSSFIDKPASCI